MINDLMIQPENSDHLKLLLLDMISTTPPVSNERFEALRESDWMALCRMASQHRVEPILHHHCRIFGSDWRIPDEVKVRWQAMYRRSALKALEARRTLIRVSKLLDKAHIPYAALKGSWLMNKAYSDPALRPMRDIDILVDIDDAVAAFELLQSIDFQRGKEDLFLLSYYIENTRDMPVLFDKNTGVKFEIHFRVTDDDRLKPNSSLSNSRLLLEQRTDASSDEFGISYLSPTHGLLHLIVHSAYDHQFNNGPLILYDIARFVENADVDWEHFWHMADLGDWRNGCNLIFALTSRYHAQCRERLPNATKPAIPESILNAASLLMLQDFHERTVVAHRTEMAALGSPWSRLVSLGRRAFPSRYITAPLVGLQPESRLFWLGYPIWLVLRGRQYLFRKWAPSLRKDIHNAILVDRWLKAT